MKDCIVRILEDLPEVVDPYNPNHILIMKKNDFVTLPEPIAKDLVRNRMGIIISQGQKTQFEHNSALGLLAIRNRRYKMVEKQKIWNFDSLAEGMSFAGQIVSAEWEDGRYGEQLHLQVKPLDHEIKGETGVYHEWFTPSERKNSKWGAFLKSLKEAGVEIKTEAELVGKTFKFEKKTIEFGDEYKAEDVLLPIELVEKTETSTDPTIWAELEKQLKATGLTDSQLQRWAQKNGITKKELNEYMKQLEKAGRLEKDSEGIYTLSE